MFFGTPPKKEVKRWPHLIKWYPKTCVVYRKTFPSRKFVILTFYWISRLEKIVCKFAHTLCSSHKALKKKLFVQEVQYSKILFRWMCQMQTTDYNVKSLKWPNFGCWFFWIGSYQCKYNFGFCEIVCEDVPHNNICGSIKNCIFWICESKVMDILNIF
jgi:hypothetical protein